MLICPVCGKVNPPDSRNCDVCGAPLAHAERVPSVQPSSPVNNGVEGPFSGPICPTCRRPNRSASVFCAHCGQRLRQNTGGQVYALPHVGAAPPDSRVAPPTAPVPAFSADVTGNIPAGTVLKRRYRILRKVAQGGMGAVYESTDQGGQQGSRYAIKEISPAALPPGERTQAVADFRREAQMLASLQHPNLVTVVETFEELGKHFLVMEFVPGRSLLNVLDAAGGSLPEDRVLVWARQVADVIQYLHHLDPPIIYRDLKPANIMLVEGTERIKLIDFGIARSHKADKAHDTEAFGTAGYAPPEQYGKGQTDQRSDIYAFAATLHHLLTNRDPSLNPFNWLPARRYNTNVSVRVDNALTEALNLDPLKRYQSIEAFARALGTDLPLSIAVPSVQPQATASAQAPAPITIHTAKTIAPAKQKSTTPPKKRPQPQAEEAPAAASVAVPTPMPEPLPPQVIQVPQANVPVFNSPFVIKSAAPAPQKAVQPPTQEAPAPDVVNPTAAVAAPDSVIEAHEPAPAKTPAPKPRSKPLEIKIPKIQDEELSGTPSSELVISERLVDLGSPNWNRKPMRRVQLQSAGGERVEGKVLASQPWIAYNPAHFNGSTVTLEVKVRRRQLRFGQVQLQVPNLFAIIWARTRRVLPFIGCWFWLLLLVASSLGRVLLWGLAGTVGALLLAEALLWLWSVHVRFLVPSERLNTGRLWVKSSGGDQQIEVRVMARPSWIRKAAGWTMALVLLTAELAGATWLALTLVGVPLGVIIPGL